MNPVPMPVTFNCWKHHLMFIKEEIIRKDVPELRSLASALKVIGDGLMDLYFGSIQPEDISNMILSKLKPLINKSDYINWLNEEGQDFRKVKIDDGSLWVLRSGEDDDRYVHIHPARYSLYTMRIKAATLKTAILTCYYSRQYNDEIDLDLINRLREHILKLSPVKDIQSVPALNKIINILIS